MNVAAALISVPSKKEIYLTHTIYFFYGLNNYFPKMDENAVIYTDKEFGGMYNSYVTRPEGLTLYRYVRSDLEEMGAVAYYGMVPYTTRPIDSEVKVKILVPNSLRGKDLRLRLEVPYSNTASKPQCQAVEVSYEDGRAIPGGTYEEGFFMADIKMEEQIKGFLDLSVRLPGEPQPSEPQSGPKGDGLVCGFDFKGVSLDILNNPIAPEP
jgi:hypothetical protein